jgi:hypothetical protein
VPWRVCRPVVADSHHFDEKLDLAPVPHQSGKRDPDPPPPSLRNVVLKLVLETSFGFQQDFGL